MLIAVDYDQTLCDEGAEVPLAIATLNECQRQGATLVLWTNRTLFTLWIAKRWCKQRGLKFDAVNRLWWQWFIPWSPKIYANVFIDDRNACCPHVLVRSGKPCVDWSIVGPAVLEMINA